MRTAVSIEAQQNQEQEKPSELDGKQRRNAAIAPYRFKPGQSGNPGGRPKRDAASEICQQLFENNPELVYKGLMKQLAKGNGFVFKEAADRAYGKLKEQLEVSGSMDLVERLRAGRKRVAEAKK